MSYLAYLGSILPGGSFSGQGGTETRNLVARLGWTRPGPKDGKPLHTHTLTDEVGPPCEKLNLLFAHTG
jgi:hypothetical protein